MHVVNNLKAIINDVTSNIDKFQFNKSVAKIYEYSNLLNDSINKNILSVKNYEWGLKKLAIILQPFVPHLSEEIWSEVGGGQMCIEQSWPNEKVEDEKKKSNIAIQVNGKTRSVISVNNSITKKMLLEIVMKDRKILKYIENKSIKKEVYVPGKILNLVL